jgi:hypothetical protein
MQGTSEWFSSLKCKAQDQDDGIPFLHSSGTVPHLHQKVTEPQSIETCVARFAFNEVYPCTNQQIKFRYALPCLANRSPVSISTSERSNVP